MAEFSGQRGFGRDCSVLFPRKDMRRMVAGFALRVLLSSNGDAVLEGYGASCVGGCTASDSKKQYITGL